MRIARTFGVAALLCGMAAPLAHGAEQLLVPQLPGWKIISSVRDAQGESTELIPERESKERWTRRFAVQAFRGSTLDVNGFLDQVVQQSEPVCEQTQASPINGGMVGQAPAGSRAVSCSRYRGDGQGNYALYFVIRGREALYVVSRLWRGDSFRPTGQSPLDPGELQDWTNHLNSIELCGYDPSRPCRQDKAAY